MLSFLSWIGDKFAEVIAPKAVTSARRLLRRMTPRVRIALGMGVAITVLLTLFAPQALLLLRAAGGASGIPLSSRASATLETTWNHLNGRVVTDLLDDAGAQQSAATMAASMTAVDGLSGDDRTLLTTVLMRAVDPRCGCWVFPSEGNHAPHTANTAWSLYALAVFGSPPPDSAVMFLLSAQQPSGAWPLHRTSEFGSTYATAVSLLALQMLVDDDLVSRPVQVRAKRAIAKGHSWLISRRLPRQARWQDYPNARTGQPLPSVSGLVMFALHQVQRDNLAELDRTWLQTLPVRPPRWDAIDTSRDLQVINETGDVSDSITFPQWPWLVLGTVAAYPNGTVREQATALAWLEYAVAKTGLDQAQFEEREGAPEFLMALRALLKRVG